jgi:hypothetical protein
MQMVRQTINQKRRVTMPIEFTEHAEQAEVIRWAMSAPVLEDHPEVKWLFAIPNGAKLPYSRDARGNRHCNQANILKDEGLKSGVPDLCLPVPAGGYHGLYIEMKSLSKSAKLSAEQKAWIEGLNALGYRAVVCFGCEAAKLEIVNYLLRRTAGRVV